MSRKFLAIWLTIGLLIGLPVCYLLLNMTLNQEQYHENFATSMPTPIETPIPTQEAIPNSTISDSRIFCSVDKYQTSNIWVDNSPVIAYYYPDGDFEPKFVPMPQTAYLFLRITNNNSQPLYDTVVEVNYQTSEGSWKTINQAIGSLDVYGLKTENITLTNPALRITNSTQLNMYDPNHRSINITYYVLWKGYFEFRAYGYASER
jgi:hypothetical protein